MASIVGTVSVSIVQPVEGETYNGDWLPFKVIVENENELPDSVVYSLNGSAAVAVPRLNTDWPTYMQNYQNHGYSESPAPTDNSILWTAPVCGEIHEFPTPIVAEGCVYYPQDGYYSGDTLYALDAATGDIRWTHRVGYTDDSPTCRDGLLYLSSDSIFCLNAETGDDEWFFCPEEEMESTGSPIVTEGVVYFFTSGAFIDSSIVHAADAETGELIWTRGLSASMESSAAYEDGILYIPLCTFGMPPETDESLFAIDVSDGSVIWSNDDTENGYWDSSPCIVQDHIYIGGNDGYLHAFNKYDGTSVWTRAVHSSGLAIEPSPACNGELLFTGCSNWRKRGCVAAFRRENGEMIWNRDGLILHGSFGLADDLALMGVMSADSIIALDQNTGLPVWAYRFGDGRGETNWDGCQSSPSITDGIMYMPATDGNLYAFGTGMKYTYVDDIQPAEGFNTLTVTAYSGGEAVATETVSFTAARLNLLNCLKSCRVLGHFRLIKGLWGFFNEGSQFVRDSYD